MYISIVSQVKDFRNLEKHWDSIAKIDTESTPFQLFAWSYYWWKHLHGNKQLLILLCKRNQDIFAIFPMWQRVLQNGIRVLEFIGSRGTDYLSPLILDDHFRVYQLVFDSIVKNELCDVINFEDIQEYHSLVVYCKKLEFQKKLVIEERESSPCYTIPLPATWNDYLIHLSKRSSFDALYDRRYLKKHFASIEFEFATSSKKLSKHIEIHQKRRKSCGTHGTYHLQETRNFFTNLVSDWESKKILRLSMLSLNREPVASILSCEWHDKIFAIHTGFDPVFKKYSVGNVLYGYCIEEAIKRGLREYDLSRGYDVYKKKWKSVYRKNIGLLISQSQEKIIRYKKGIKKLHAVMGYSPTYL